MPDPCREKRERWTAILEWFGYLSMCYGTYSQRRWIGRLFHDKILPGQIILLIDISERVDGVVAEGGDIVR